MFEFKSNNQNLHMFHYFEQYSCSAKIALYKLKYTYYKNHWTKIFDLIFDHRDVVVPGLILTQTG